MSLTILMFFAGLAMLYYGAEFLVKGSANTAVILGVNPIVVGLTVVAFGTSMPELVVCLIAAYRDSDTMVMGNVIGSNIANIGLVMAAGAVIYPISIQRRTLTRELPYMIFLSGLMIFFGFDGTISKLDGTALFAGILLFTGYSLRNAMRKKEDASPVEEEIGDIIESESKLWVELSITVLGVAGVVSGAYLLVESATAIARSLGVSELVIGISVLAVGTSLPELATTAIAAFRRHSDIAVGTIIGSNIFNIGSVLAITAIYKPLPVTREMMSADMMVMMLFSIAVIPAAWRLKMDRVTGALLLFGYSGFIYWIAAYRTI